MMTVGHDPPAALSDWTIDVLTGRRRHFPKRRMTEAATQNIKKEKGGNRATFRVSSQNK